MILIIQNRKVINKVINHKVTKIKKLSHQEETSSIFENTGIRSAVMWSNSNGKESITVICHPDTKSVSV